MATTAECGLLAGARRVVVAWFKFHDASMPEKLKYNTLHGCNAVAEDWVARAFISQCHLKVCLRHFGFVLSGMQAWLIQAAYQC